MDYSRFWSFTLSDITQNRLENNNQRNNLASVASLSSSSASVSASTSASSTVESPRHQASSGNVNRHDENMHLQDNLLAEKAVIQLRYNALTDAKYLIINGKECPPNQLDFIVFGNVEGKVVITQEASKGLALLSMVTQAPIAFKAECFVQGSKISENNERLKDDSDSSSLSSIKILVPQVILCGDFTAWYLVSVENIISSTNAADSHPNTNSPFKALLALSPVRVHRRFSDFCTLHSNIQNAYRGTHMLSSLPDPPKKYSKILSDHLNPTFLEQRRQELEKWLMKILKIPGVLRNPDVEEFFGIFGRGEIRERSVAFKPGRLGLTLKKIGGTTNSTQNTGSVSSLASSSESNSSGTNASASSVDGASNTMSSLPTKAEQNSSEQIEGNVSASAAPSPSVTTNTMSESNLENQEFQQGLYFKAQVGNVSQRNENGEPEIGQAEESKQVKVGDLVAKISGESVLPLSYEQIVESLKIQPRPVMVHFLGSVVST